MALYVQDPETLPGVGHDEAPARLCPVLYTAQFDGKHSSPSPSQGHRELTPAHTASRMPSFLRSQEGRVLTGAAESWTVSRGF